MEGDAYFSFKQIVDYAVDMELPIIAAGDLIDKQKNESRVVSFLSEQIKRLEDAEVDLLYIQGQHELQPHTPWLSAISSHPWHLHNETMHLEGINFMGFDWSPPELVAENLKAVPSDIDVLVMHQVTQEWMGGIAPAELCFSQVPYARALIIGDYHEISGTESHRGAQGQDLTVLSPGSTCLQSISEPRKKSCYLLHSDLTFEALPIRTRSVLAPGELSMPEQLDAFVENVGHQIESATEKAIAAEYPPELHKPILYVKYLSCLEGAYARIDKAVGDKAHLFFKELRPAPTEEQQQERQVREAIIENGLLGALDTAVPDLDSTRYNLAYRLLSSKNPREELTAIREERLRIGTET